MPRPLSLRFLLVIALSIAASTARADEAFVGAFQADLQSAQLDAAETLARKRLEVDPSDAQARFALGAAQFLQAVEGLGQGLYDHGLTRDRALPDYLPGVTDLPFLRIPVPHNPNPQPFTAEAMRRILVQFSAGLMESEATLAQVPKGPMLLQLDVQKIAFDYDRDGQANAYEGLPSLIWAISGLSRHQTLPAVGFDESDVTWLRGYAHLLAGITDIILAHDFSEMVNLTFQTAFPASDLPGLPLNVARAQAMAQFEANRMSDGSCWNRKIESWDDSRTPEMEADVRRDIRCQQAREALEYGGIADLVAFVHLFRWPLVEPDRLLSARLHFLSMIALSRESWASILAETDDNAEWVPGPKQTSLLGNLRVNENILAGWMDFLDQAEGVLEGRLLLPHWRFGRSQGVNLRRMFEEPRTLDPIMILTGAGAVPYMEEGELAAGSTLNTAMDVLDGGLLAYFLWFN